MTYAIPAFICLFGAAFQELLYWHQLRSKLKVEEYAALLRSTAYWVITGLMIVVTPIAVLLWFSENLTALRNQDYLILGASFPLMFKAGVSSAIAGGSKVKLGKGPADRAPNSAKTYFGL